MSAAKEAAGGCCRSDRGGPCNLFSSAGRRPRERILEFCAPEQVAVLV